MIKVTTTIIAFTLSLVICSSCSSELNTTTLENSRLNNLKQAEQGKDSDAIQKANYLLARYYSEEGKYDKAIPYYLKFLDLKRNEPVDTYHGLAWNLAELASLYFHVGQYSIAIPVYQEAIHKLYEYDRYADTISPLDELAMCYWKIGDSTVAQLKFTEAEDNYKRSIALPALKSQKSILDVEYALMLEHWADMLDARGKKDNAKELGEKAAKIWLGLRQQCNLSSSARKVETIKSLVQSYCRSGKRAEAFLLMNILLNVQSNRADVVSQVREMEKECLRVNAEQSNPYLTQFNSMKSRQDYFDNRQLLCQKYAWAVPNQNALKVLLEYQPLIEIGAGTGYWASLLRKSGGQIVAGDVHPVPSKANPWHALAGDAWADMLFADETIAREYPGHTLFLSWPPEVNQCAYNALRLYKGKFVIYVGEDGGGCTGSKDFHDLLARDWNLVKEVEIAQWPGVYDKLYVYSRKKPVAAGGDKVTARSIEKVLGPQLAKLAEKSPIVSGDVADLLEMGIKIQFVPGRKRAFFDRKTKTIYISKASSDSEKLLALSHEYSHVALNPTLNPTPGKTGREEFIRQGIEQEADAVVHELIAAEQLKDSGMPLDKATVTLLYEYKTKGRQAVFEYILAAKNSATKEDYVQHFNKWYDETVPRSAARP